MPKYKKIVCSFLLGAVVSVSIYYSVLFFIPNIIDLNKYKESVTEEIKKQTGFSISCEDIKFKRSLIPYLNVNLYHTVILYPDEQIFLKLKEANLKIKILPLLSKKIVIKDTKLIRPIINVTLYSDFSTSIEKYILNNKQLSDKHFNLNIDINDITCDSYKLKIQDDSIKKLMVLEGDKLLLKDINKNNKARFILQGALSQDKNTYFKYDLDITSPLKHKKFTFSPFKQIVDSNIKGNVFGHLKIKKENQVYGDIKISDLSLQVENTNLTDNNINLSFNGDKVDIKSILHTSKTDTVDVSGKFSYGKNKYIELKTIAKHINLSNLHKILTLLTDSLNIQNKLREVNVNGILNAEFDITSDFKKLKSNGTAKIINAVLSHKSLPYDINEINADISFNNNKIEINNAIANINKTPIKLSGEINEDVSFNINATSHDLNLVNIVNLFDLNKDLPVNIKSGKISFDSNIEGILNKKYNAETKVKLENLSLIEKSYNIPIKTDFAELNIKNNEKTYSGDIVLKNLSSSYQKYNIKAAEFISNFDNNIINIPENTLLLPLKLNFSGSIKNYLTKPEGNIKIKNNINSEELGKLINNYIKLPYKASGNIKTTASIDFDSEKANVNLKMEPDSNNYISYLVINELLNKPSVFNLECNINKEEFNIKNLSLSNNPENNILKVSGKILNNKDLSFKNLNINIPKTLTFATSFFGGEEVSLNGNLTLNERIEKPAISGSLKLFKYNMKKYLTSIQNADISFSEKNIRVIAPDVQVNDSKINIIIDLIPDFKDITISDIQINSYNLDLNSLFPLIKKELNPFAESLITIKKGYATINNFQILDLKAKDVTSDISLNKNILKAENISAKAYDGLISGKADYDIAHGTLNTNMSGKGINIKNSLYDLCKLKDNLEGRTDFDTEFSIQTGGKYEEVLKSLNGKINFTAYDGKMGTLGKFEYYLYAQNMLYHGLLNATLNRISNLIKNENTAKYKIANGKVLFQNGFLITDGIKTTGSNMSLYVKGKHNILTNQSNITIYGRISDEIKNKLGSFGNISLSELINVQQGIKSNILLKVPSDIMQEIPNLYNSNNTQTNTFKVNVYGNIYSLNSINSFMWTVSDEKLNQLKNETENKEPETINNESEKLPDFSDMINNL